MIVDGVPTDVIDKVETSALDAISKFGGYASAFVGGEKMVIHKLQLLLLLDLTAYLPAPV